MTNVATNSHTLVGKIIGDGRYDVREMLGGGSMGQVYRAFDRRLETQVVLKIPHRSRLDHPDFHRRFRQESRFLVRLRHPHVVGILDLGEHDGLPYFVMPFVPGGSLRDRQRTETGALRAIPVISFREWLSDVAEALDFIHSNRCVHRDVKPDNILFDEHGRVFLSDFGLSKLLETDGKDDVAQTAAGAIVGTPLYVAPELVLGEPFDGRADQYSLAVTVYEVLTGTNPFAGANSSATMVNQTTKEPAELSELNPQFSQALSTAVARGLSKDPDDRRRTCREFAHDVLSTVDCTPVSSKSGSAKVQPPGTSSSATRSVLSRSSIRRPKKAAGDDPADGTDGQSRASSTMQRLVATASSPIVKAKTCCPSCSRTFTLHPATAGRRATCKSCGARLLITANFSELLKLEAIERNPNSTANRFRQEDHQSVLVLGQSLFGLRLSQRWAIRLAIALGIFLLLMVALFTRWHDAEERDRIREQLRPRNLE